MTRFSNPIRRSLLINVPSFSPQPAAGKTKSANLAVSADEVDAALDVGIDEVVAASVDEDRVLEAQEAAPSEDHTISIHSKSLLQWSSTTW